jgi:hypothetical protein
MLVSSWVWWVLTLNFQVSDLAQQSRSCVITSALKKHPASPVNVYPLPWPSGPQLSFVALGPRRSAIASAGKLTFDRFQSGTLGSLIRGFVLQIFLSQPFRLTRRCGVARQRLSRTRVISPGDTFGMKTARYWL